VAARFSGTTKNTKNTNGFAPRELDGQAFLVDGLKEADPHLPADLEDGALNLIGLVCVQHAFVFFVFFVVHSSGA